MQPWRSTGRPPPATGGGASGSAQAVVLLESSTAVVLLLVLLVLLMVLLLVLLLVLLVLLVLLLWWRQRSHGQVGIRLHCFLIQAIARSVLNICLLGFKCRAFIGQQGCPCNSVFGPGCCGVDASPADKRKCSVQLPLSRGRTSAGREPNPQRASLSSN